MNQSEEIVELLRNIQRKQDHEAKLARNRWRTAVTVLACSAVIAAPAILSYVRRLLVHYF